MSENCLVESLYKYIGQTVTVFTTSGGESGYGFTGVLAAVSNGCIKLITDIGAAPSCPIGSNCGFRGGCQNNGCQGSCQGNGGNGLLGSVTEIPLCKIAGFTHNAI